jgi:hypothetical protein
MTRRYRKDHDLMGMEADDLLSNFDVLNEDDIWQYRYPEDVDLNSVGVRGIYLNNYVRWDPKAQHEQMIELYDYKTAKFSRTFDCYDFVDCYNYMNLHDLTKMYKCGYSKVTDHACREIRHGRLTRKQAINLVNLYQNQSVEYIQLMYDWLNIELNGLMFVLDTHRNKKYWSKDNNNYWVFKNKFIQNNIELDNCKPSINFLNNASVSLDRNDFYITIGKGWP